MASTSSSFRSSAAQETPGSSRVGRWVVAIAALLALAAAAAWLLGWFGGRIDPRVAEIRELRKDMAEKFQAGGGPASLADATAMMTAMNEIRQRIDALPEHLRPQAERGGGGMFRSAMRGRIDAYFTAPPAQRQAVLDRQIEQEELMRKASAAVESVTGAVGGAKSAPLSPVAAGGPPRGGTEEDRNKWRKSLIDRTSPAERARYVEYRRAMEERRQQRGLPASGWGR